MTMKGMQKKQTATSLALFKLTKNLYYIWTLMKDSRKALTINRNPMNSIKSTKKDKDMATIHLQIHSFGKIASWPFSARSLELSAREWQSDFFQSAPWNWKWWWWRRTQKKQEWLKEYWKWWQIIIYSWLLCLWLMQLLLNLYQSLCTRSCLIGPLSCSRQSLCWL